METATATILRQPASLDPNPADVLRNHRYHQGLSGPYVSSDYSESDFSEETEEADAPPVRRSKQKRRLEDPRPADDGNSPVPSDEDIVEILEEAKPKRKGKSRGRAAAKPKKRGGRNVRTAPGGEISARGTVSAMRQVQRLDQEDETAQHRNETIMTWMARVLIHQARLDPDSEAYVAFSKRLNARVHGLDVRGVVHAVANTAEDRELIREYFHMLLDSALENAPSVLPERFDCDAKKAAAVSTGKKKKAAPRV